MFRNFVDRLARTVKPRHRPQPVASLYAGHAGTERFVGTLYADGSIEYHDHAAEPTDHGSGSGSAACTCGDDDHDSARHNHNGAPCLPYARIDG